MARLQLSKSSLNRENVNLKKFSKFLPSLDLKRRQLIAERARSRVALDEEHERIAQFRKIIGEKLPMLSNREVDLQDLVTLKMVTIGEENVVGTRLPVLESIEVEVRDYALLGKPQWVDAVAESLRDMMKLQVRARIERRRLAALEQAVKTVTQRVNLFEKVLVPRAQENIKRIRIYLSDADRAAVVRSKIAKKKRAAEKAL